MERSHHSIKKLPDVPGVYLFKKGRTVLYVGKATSLRDRVKSYFDDDLIATRGPRIVDMVTKADKVAYETTPTVLEALVREAALIKKYMPSANTDGKDDSTFLYAVVTEEEIPRVLTLRGKDIDFEARRLKRLKSNFNTKLKFDFNLRAVYGPFPSGPQLKEALRLIRKIFPFFDTPKPVGAKSKHHRAKIEFNTQIEQYPRLPAGRQALYDAKEYKKTIRSVMLFLSGRVVDLRKSLEREMQKAAREERFEDAAQCRRQLFALDHVQDVSLIKDEVVCGSRTSTGLRIEAYDTAHLSGTNAIGVMTVLIDGVPSKKDYRTFRIRGNERPRRSLIQNDDIASLKEILTRRLAHPEWPFPSVIVVDGGKTQKKAAETVIGESLKLSPKDILVVAVVKDEKHRPREILGARLAHISESDAVLANSEAHRFSLARHIAARSKIRVS